MTDGNQPQDKLKAHYQRLLDQVDATLADKKNRNKPAAWAFLLNSPDSADTDFCDQLGLRVFERIVNCNRRLDNGRASAAKRQYDNISNPLLGQLGELFGWSEDFERLATEFNLRVAERERMQAQLLRWTQKQQSTAIEMQVDSVPPDSIEALTASHRRRTLAFAIDLAFLMSTFVLLKFALIPDFQFAWFQAYLPLPAFAVWAFLYFWTNDGLYQGSMGKKVLGLRVVSFEGQTIGLMAGLIRTAAFFLTWLRDAHGDLSGTWVVKMPKSE